MSDDVSVPLYAPWCPGHHGSSSPAQPLSILVLQPVVHADTSGLFLKQKPTLDTTGVLWLPLIMMMMTVIIMIVIIANIVYLSCARHSAQILPELSG